MFKPIVAAGLAAVVLAGCGASNAVPHHHSSPKPTVVGSMTLAPMQTPASHVSSAGDKAACLLWYKSITAWEYKAESDSKFFADSAEAIGESTDPGFKHDVNTVVSDRKSGNYLAEGTDARNVQNDCADDGVNILNISG